MRKTYLIFGFEKSGQSAFELIYNKKDLFYIYDENLKAQSFAFEKIKGYINAFVVTNLDRKFIKSLSCIILSPGVSVYHKAVEFARKCGVEVVSELEMASRYIKTSKLIAITGTNGKTTTTRLIADILLAAKKKAVACGNIGYSLSAAVKKAKKKAFFVCETSSFQLEAIKNFKPKIACLLNITPDHINRHKTFFNYKKTKFNIAKNLDKNCYFVINKNLSRFKYKNKANCVVFNKNSNGYCCFERNGAIYFKNKFKEEFVMNLADISLPGEHNLENILCAISVCKLLKIKNEYIVKAIKNFKLDNHRIQKIYINNNVCFYDDSKATNIDATICAIKSFNSPTILILGGSDKGYEFDEVFKNLSLQIQHILCCGEVRDKIKLSANRFKRNVESFKTLKEATMRACELSKLYDGEINVLLSPACASFDEFKNYKDRGEKFLEYIKDFYEKNNQKQH